jgi:biopolymer transport protein TolR
MGMSAGGGKKGAVQSDINVTPLIDVLLVLLIIFMVVMPIMMKMETLEVPRKIQDNEEPDPNAVQLTVKFGLNSTGAGGTVVFNDGEKDATLPFTDLTNTLQPKLAGLKSGTDKVVFVDFDDNVKWGDVVHGMDTIRSIATDIDHDEIKVALKVKEDAAPAAK